MKEQQLGMVSQINRIFLKSFKTILQDTQVRSVYQYTFQIEALRKQVTCTLKAEKI